MTQARNIADRPQATYTPLPTRITVTADTGVACGLSALKALSACVQVVSSVTSDTCSGSTAGT